MPVTTSLRVPTLPGHVFNLPAELEGLGELAYNLWWSWTPRAQALFSRINGGAWTRHRNAIAVMRYTDQRGGRSSRRTRTSWSTPAACSTSSSAT